jgi:hypothetical protein
VAAATSRAGNFTRIVRRPCPCPAKLCHHPERKAVETAFASGMTDREIGRRFGVSHYLMRQLADEGLIDPRAKAYVTLQRSVAYARGGLGRRAIWQPP